MKVCRDCGGNPHKHWCESEHWRGMMQRAWAEGYLRGTLDAISDLEPADNPYDEDRMMEEEN